MRKTKLCEEIRKSSVGKNTRKLRKTKITHKSYADGMEKIEQKMCGKYARQNYAREYAKVL